MKVVHVVTRSDTMGGANVHVREVCVALQAQGHDVVVLVGGEGIFTQHLSKRRIPYRSVPYLVREISPVRDVLAYYTLRKMLRELQPDVVCTHSSKAGWLGRLAAWSEDLPAIFTAHGWAFTEGVSRPAAALYRVVESVAARFASRIITVSDYDRRLAVKYGVAKDDRLSVVHNGMPDLSEGATANPEQSPPRLVMVARFDKQKDHSMLLRALASLREEAWSLDLIGDGPLRRDCEALASSLGIAVRIRFMGSRDDVELCLAKCQVLVLASHWEGLPLSIIEGMRAGLPVVATDVGGVPELVIDEVSGFVVARGSERMLKDRLQRVIREPALRKRMGGKGREIYESRLTVDKMLTNTMQVYRQVIADAT